jgi:hypothetical protein
MPLWESSTLGTRHPDNKRVGHLRKVVKIGSAVNSYPNKRTSRNSRAPSQHLLNEPIHVLKLWPVLYSGQPIKANHIIDLPLSPFLRLREQQHRQDEYQKSV